MRALADGVMVLKNEGLQAKPHNVLRLATAEQNDDHLGECLRSDDLDTTSLGGVVVFLHDKNLDRRAAGARGWS